MGGDQGNGLALVILIVMVLMVVGGIALFAFAGRLLTRKLAPPRRHLVTLLMALVGAGLGWLLVIATFYESTLWPPPRLGLTAAPGFDATVVILLEDPRSPRTLEWRGSGLPFSAAAGEIAVPPSGIVRVRSFGPIGVGAYFEVTWFDGGRGFLVAGGNRGPPGTGATAYHLLEPPDARPDARPDKPPPGAPQSYDGPALAAYIAQRERRR